MIRTRQQGDTPLESEKLKKYKAWELLPEEKVCLAVEVYKAISELKAKLESVQASAYADSVDAGMRERRLQRALYKACANWSKSFKTTAEMLGAHADAVKWDKMEHKCLKKAEEYRQ